jgi:hypothetical protein
MERGDEQVHLNSRGCYLPRARTHELSPGLGRPETTGSGIQIDIEHELALLRAHTPGGNWSAGADRNEMRPAISLFGLDLIRDFRRLHAFSDSFDLPNLGRVEPIQEAALRSPDLIVAIVFGEPRIGPCVPLTTGSTFCAVDLHDMSAGRVWRLVMDDGVLVEAHHIAWSLVELVRCLRVLAEKDQALDVEQVVADFGCSSLVMGGHDASPPPQTTISQAARHVHVMPGVDLRPSTSRSEEP